jgi:hypothetical protein
MAFGETSLVISILTIVFMVFDKIRKSKCVKIHSSCCCGDIDIERDLSQNNDNDDDELPISTI